MDTPLKTIDLSAVVTEIPEAFSNGIVKFFSKIGF
jgi:hypothetical protein|tara:strand:- start:1628 stop:1732 length:105 start_codon:yes stop_codon:yes gene_type:complete